MGRGSGGGGRASRSGASEAELTLRANRDNAERRLETLEREYAEAQAVWRRAPVPFNAQASNDLLVLTGEQRRNVAVAREAMTTSRSADRAALIADRERQIVGLERANRTSQRELDATRPFFAQGQRAFVANRIAIRNERIKILQDELAVLRRR